VEELRELQRWVATPMVDQESRGVREHFAQQPTCQMPEVFCPHPLYGVTSAQLRKDGIYPVAKTAQISAPFGIGISFLGGVGGQQLDCHARQLFLGFGRVVVAVPDDDPGGELDEFGEHGKLVGVGRSYRQASDDARPADPHVYSKAVEGLLEEGVFTESRLSPETFAPVGASEQAHRQGQRVADGEGGIVRGFSQELLPEVLFDLPEVGCLPAEGGAMHSPELRKEVGIVLPEVRKELCILGYPQKLAYDLDGEHFRVAERGGGSACSEAPEVSDTIVYEAEDGYDEGVKIHESGDLLLASVGLGTTERREVSLSIQPSGETCTRG
jgi:hypothetical protein